MSTVTVRGIDRDGESRVLEVSHLSVAVLAADLTEAGWKTAVILDDGEIVGGVRLDPGAHHRVPWTTG